jgi:large subunit ribosomal protein L18|tara:strand:- start:10012 stop:10368 length:357 start_codon:yes stop_codon:yes gene_type:complete
MATKKMNRRQRIHMRIRNVVKGTDKRPRLAVYRSSKEIYAQLIDDVSGKTLGTASSLSKNGEVFAGTKIERAFKVGKMIAEVAKGVGVESVSFDRGGYLYHGRIKSLADGARQAGLKF